MIWSELKSHMASNGKKKSRSVWWKVSKSSRARSGNSGLNPPSLSLISFVHPFLLWVNGAVAMYPL